MKMKCTPRIALCAASIAYTMPAHCVQLCTVGGKGLRNMLAHGKMHLRTLCRHGRCCQEAWNRQAYNHKSTHSPSRNACYSRCHADRRHEDALSHVHVVHKVVLSSLAKAWSTISEKSTIVALWKTLMWMHCRIFNDAATPKLTKLCLTSKIAQVKIWYKRTCVLSRMASAHIRKHSHVL